MMMPLRYDVIDHLFKYQREPFFEYNWAASFFYLQKCKNIKLQQILRKN